MTHTPTAAMLAIALAMIVAPNAHAHDFWIMPSSFTPKVGERVDVGLRIGHFDDAESVARNSQRIEQFVLVAPDGSRAEIVGQDGKSPAGVVRIDHAGWHILAYDSNHATSTLEAAKFEGYLQEEGLERVIEDRAKRGETKSDGVEIYSRCAKALLCAGDAGPSAAMADRALGLELELVAQKNPASLKGGDEMPVLLLLDGRPVEGVKIDALNATHPHGAASARTDKAGRASLKLPKGGVWLIHAVHMTRLPPEHEADWESMWASLTFETPSK